MNLWSEIDPEAAAFNLELEELLLTYPRLTDLTPAEARRQREEGRSAFGALVLSPEAEERTLPLQTGSRRARLFLPRDPRGVYLHLHGGGWVLGGIHHQDPRLSQLSEQTGLVVVSVDYRLAPEAPYPAGPDDCEAAAAWLVEHARAEFGTGNLYIGGESAGAHLAVVTMLRMRDRHGFTDWKGANLVYGVYDLRLTPSARHWGDRLLVLNTPIIGWFVEHFTPGADLAHPDVSPLFAPLAGLPPALFTVGTEDPLLDDSLFMYQRWLAAGNQAELAVYPGGAHGFDAFPIGIGRAALAAMHRFLKTH
jgi:acetyl esterase/lipase